jgi:hypothetical protein
MVRWKMNAFPTTPDIGTDAECKGGTGEGPLLTARARSAARSGMTGFVHGFVGFLSVLLVGGQVEKM